MASLGQELKRERELRGISLREIADSTRINLRFLQAVEEDRLDVIPGIFFVRAILRSYANAIGIDEHQVLNKYQESYTFEEQLQYRESRERPRPRFPSRFVIRRSVWIPALALAVFGLGLFLLLEFFSNPKNQPSVQVKPAQSIAQIEVPKRNPPLEPVPLVEEIQGLRLKIAFSEETWLHVYADGKSAWDGVKNKGETLDIRAERELLLNIGNAGGAELTINGKKARPLGPRGAVRLDIRITPENYLDFLVQEEDKTG